MIDKTLYIHIGSHKTGTTSIQKAMFDNSEYLKSLNYECFTESYDNINQVDGSSNSWISFLSEEADFTKGSRILDKKKLSEKLSILNSKNVIISSEQFSFIFDDNELFEFKNELDNFFSKIIIIVYIRRQDRHIVSHHMESAYKPESNAAIFFGKDVKALPSYKKHFDLYLNYYEKIKMWAKVFGKGNLIIRNFENLYKNDSVEDFFQLFKIDTKDMKISIINQSRGKETTKIGLILNENDEDVMVGSNMFNILFTSLDNSGKLLPTRFEAQEFYNRYKESNKNLNKIFSISLNENIFDNNFSMYPENNDDIWDEASANKAILNLIKGFNKTYGKFDLNVILNAVLKLERIDVELSRDLLKMVILLIPENKDLIMKLDSYDKFILENKK